MHSVVRTWLWLGEILGWYDELNEVRRKFFRRCGLIAVEGKEPKLPASTGIGIRPVGPAICSMDARGVVATGLPSHGGPTNGELIAYFNAAGRQDSPFRYGSAFSRAATAVSPAGKTLFISGSAAIDPAGASCHLGDAHAQIDMTLRHIRAILAEHGCGDGEVVQAMAYCKTPAVAAAWRAGWPDFEWPVVTLIADVCRDDLLFEAELMACPGVKRGLR
jgi:enamine deaminase RidA (YjgF/YER057c/UK114 family)